MRADYNVYELDFPNRSTAAMVFVNDDGSFDVYLNTLLPEERRRRALEHELRHIEKEHFYAELPLELAERQADGESVNIVLHTPAGELPHFYSESSFAHWLKNVCVQSHVDLGAL